MTLIELQKKVRENGWKCNNCSFYMVETGDTPYKIAVIMGVCRSAVSYWLHHEKLSGAVDFLFLYARKMWIQRGVRISDMF